MATHKTGSETHNVSVNLLDQEKLIFARIAIAEDRSLGDVIRRFAVAGLRSGNPEAAEQIEQLRREHRQDMLNL